MPDTYEMLEARDRFAAGQYADALVELNKIPEAERGGEWYVFRSEIEDKLERYYDALHSLRLAIELDPKNQAYKERLKNYRKKLKDSVSGEKVKSGCLPACCGNECCTSDFCCECSSECCCECCCEICDGPC